MPFRVIVTVAVPRLVLSLITFPKLALLTAPVEVFIPRPEDPLYDRVAPLVMVPPEPETPFQVHTCE